MQLCSTWHSVATLLPIPLDNNTRAWAQDILCTCPSLFKPFDVLVLPTSWRICSGRDGECRVHCDAVSSGCQGACQRRSGDNNLQSAIHMHDLQMAHLVVEANARTWRSNPSPTCPVQSMPMVSSETNRHENHVIETIHGESKDLPWVLVTALTLRSPRLAPLGSGGRPCSNANTVAN